MYAPLKSLLWPKPPLNNLKKPLCPKLREWQNLHDSTCRGRVRIGTYHWHFPKEICHQLAVKQFCELAWATCSFYWDLLTQSSELNPVLSSVQVLGVPMAWSWARNESMDNLETESGLCLGRQNLFFFKTHTFQTVLYGIMFSKNKVNRIKYFKLYCNDLKQILKFGGWF